jgi:hypothetical protein
MKTGTKVLIGVGSALVIGGAAFAYIKLRLSESEKQFIKGVNGWLTYQRSNNWGVVNQGDEARVQSAVYEMLRVDGKGELDLSKASQYNLGTWADAYAYALAFMKHYKF